MDSAYEPPLALEIIGTIFIGVALCFSLWIAVDIVRRRGWRTMMAIMIPVYILNALYLAPITLWTYLNWGRPPKPLAANHINETDRDTKLVDAEKGEPHAHMHMTHEGQNMHGPAGHADDEGHGFDVGQADPVHHTDHDLHSMTAHHEHSPRYETNHQGSQIDTHSVHDMGDHTSHNMSKHEAHDMYNPTLNVIVSGHDMSKHADHNLGLQADHKTDDPLDQDKLKHARHDVNPHGGHNISQHMHMMDERPMFATITIAVCHCGAACLLGDIVGEWLVWGVGAQINGRSIWAEWLVDYAFALVFGIVFQYWSIAPMSGEYGPKTLWRAAKADFLSLTGFQIGLFGWMAIFQLAIWQDRLQMNNVVYWWMMQVGMFMGHWTAFPVNWWLIKNRIKEPCA
ncbi:hypothetical protein DACRYDRAFT_110713 [Dacryopinax primogenitus]|uniref:DUF4396 domain-containing protein n=1 Tax=Dacryopinax primogenitus (strain DJM 731) TaxID=1858805 RepID=M5FPW5_DACPD|nr:uncharacterized protein DACRYDRAFT_110713 [Dacryopinax primogenitus]EJT98825.1 hypothetical protein DACRYDRAFT_110713 [Dacryopinax primogenitus]